MGLLYKIQLINLNYLLTSVITSYAAFPTASMAQLVKIKTVVEPNNPLKKTSGIMIFICSSLTVLMKFISSTKAANNKKHAKLAEPTEYPLVFAFVTFPTASSLSVIARTFSD